LFKKNPFTGLKIAANRQLKVRRDGDSGPDGAARTPRRGSIEYLFQFEDQALDAGKVRLGGYAPSLPPVRVSAEAIADAGKVRLGGYATSLPPVRVSAEAVTDTGKVRLGGYAPSLPPVRVSAEAVADTGKVRLGGFAPSLPR
jgi:hypothetical protein